MYSKSGHHFRAYVINSVENYNDRISRSIFPCYKNGKGLCSPSQQASNLLSQGNLTDLTDASLKDEGVVNILASVGFTSVEAYILNQQIANLLLSINLSLLRACVKIIATPVGEIQIDFQTPEHKGVTLKNGGRITVLLREDIAITDSVAILKKISDTIDEAETIKMFQNINKLHKLKSTSMANKRELNLSLALEHYENAMNASSLLLFNSLQQIVDVDGNDLMGIGFDNECNRLTGITLADIEIMRRFFDRIKHIQKDSNQVAEFQKGNQMYPCIKI